jgi:hypothetical protein
VGYKKCDGDDVTVVAIVALFFLFLLRCSAAGAAAAAANSHPAVRLMIWVANSLYSCQLAMMTGGGETKAAAIRQIGDGCQPSSKKHVFEHKC